MGSSGSREPKVVFLTGAGLSADSGIRTYRGAGGYYEGMRAEDLMSAQTMRHAPERVHRFCDDRRVSLGDAEPNEAHRMIARLAADFGPERVVHLTQNIDDCMERAGHGGTVHLHGFLTRMRSIGNSTVTRDIGYRRYWDGDSALAPEGGFQFRCPKTNSRFRPDVVLFGEAAPEYSKLWKAVGALRRHDLFVVIGTQGKVLPVQRFAEAVPCMSVLNNLHPSDEIDPEAFGKVLMCRAAEAAAEIEEIARGVLGKAPIPEGRPG